MAFYLDPVTATSGALRVIPGTHRHGDRFAEGVQAALMDKSGTLSLRGDQVPAVALESNPGDVVVFNQALKHSSWGGGNRRRMFTINATRHFAEADVQLLRNEVGALARFWPDSVYGEAMMRTAGPERLVHMQQALSQADYLAHEVVKAKATMSEPARG
jgi:ectoine hydroxylase-related dioxygenase (phytanoyl-CoA dioxygenase family)